MTSQPNPSPPSRPGVLGLGPVEWAMWLGYMILVGALAWHHEPWRDELQAWGIARASGGPLELLQNLRYEAHPPLWHLPLWLLAKVTPAPGAMQALAAAIGAAAAYVVLRWAPFGRLAKGLLIFGYMLAYEYSVVARGYGLGALLAFAACALWPRRHERPWALGLALGLLALTSAYGVLLAGAFGAAIALEQQRTGAWRRTFGASPDAAGAGLGLAVAGVLAAIVAMRPPEDFFPAAGDPGTLTAGAALGAVMRMGWAFAPIPSNWAHPWNSTALPGALSALVGLGGLALVHFAALRGRPLAQAAFWSGTAALAALAFAIYPGVVRHVLHYQLVAVIGLWLAAHEGADLRRGAARWLVAALLAPSVVATAWLAAADVRAPFSNAGAMARWIQAEGLDPTTIMGTPDFAVAGVGAWLDRPVYVLAAREPRRFVRWTKGRFAPPDLLAAPVREAVATTGTALVLTNYDLGEAVHPMLGGKATLLHTEQGGLVADEDFWLYRVTPAER